MSLWQSYLEVLTDPAHVLNELTVTVVVDFLFFGFIKRFIAKRFRARDRVHGHGHQRPVGVITTTAPVSSELASEVKRLIELDLQRNGGKFR